MRRMISTDRRQGPRHAVHLACQIVRERDFRLVSDRALSLSRSGMLVTCSVPVLTGERLLASFRLARSEFWIDTDAVVTRVVHGRRRGEAGRALAIEFDVLSSWSGSRLESDLETVPRAPPGTRPGRRTARHALRWMLTPPSDFRRALD
jgi:hypothetical protein